MELPQVILWELFDYLERGDLISLGSANKELRCIVAPALFSRLHIDSNITGYYKTNILDKYGKLCFSLHINYSGFCYNLSVCTCVLAPLVNVRCLTLQEFDIHRRSNLSLPEESNVIRLSLYNSKLDIESMFKNLTSLFILQNHGVTLDMLPVDCPLQKLVFNLVEVDLSFMEHVQILYPRLKLLNIFARYDHGDFPIICYDFKKNQTLGIGWKEKESFFSLEFYPDDSLETCMSPNETINTLYMRLIGLFSKDKMEILKLSLPRIKMFSVEHASSENTIKYPILILMQYAESICLGRKSLNNFHWSNVTYSTKKFFLYNFDGHFPCYMLGSFGESFKNLRVLCIHRFTDPCWYCVEFPQLLYFSVEFVSRHNVDNVIRGSPLLTTIYCDLGDNNCSELMRFYPHIRIKPYKKSHMLSFSDKKSMTSVFDQNA